MFKRINAYFIIAITILTSTFVLWLPYLLGLTDAGYMDVGSRLSLLDLYRHWDGALYVIVAKTWYNPLHPILLSHPLGLTTQYFTAHFPLYPALIWVGHWLVGYLPSMVIWPVVFAVLYGCLFYLLVKKHKLTHKPLALTLVALFFTPRFFVVRSAPAPETLFMFLILASIYFLLDEKYFWSSVIGSLAILTRSPGVLLGIGYGLFFATQLIKTRKFNWHCLWYLLMPMALMLVFVIYYLQTGDFWSYFHSGDNIHLLFPPFQVFNQNATWVGTGWLEDILFIYVFYLLSLFELYKQPKLRPVFWFVLTYFVAIISVEHKDIARYSLPILPFALISFERFFTSKKWLLAGIILLPALYFYAWNFMMHNTAPITDWATFL